jgi:hypothetical protein
MGALNVVAGRIERLWESDGAEYTDTTISLSPDPYDPDEIRRRAINELEFHAKVVAHLPELLPLLTEAESTDEAIDSAALLLDVDEVEVFRLARFDLLSLTRPARALRAKKLADLQGPET